MTDQKNPPQPEVIPNPAPHIWAPFVNQFYVSTIAGNVRITFGEYLYGIADPQWRAAVVIPENVALQMASLIFDLYQKQHLQAAVTPPSGVTKLAGSLIGDGS